MWEFDEGVYPGEWAEVKSPVGTPLYDVVTTQFGPAAVGAKGYVIGRTPEGEWGILVENGPAGKSRSLRAVSATDDGERIWFCGDGGSVGFYDLETGERTDYSGPEKLNGTIGAVTVAGQRGSEKLLFADTSGNVLPAYVKPDATGELDWEYPSRPGGDTAVMAITADANGVGFAVDNNAVVYRTTADEGWERVGIHDAGKSMYSAYVDGEAVLIGGGGGFVYEREEDDRWTPHNVGQFTVRAMARDDGEMLAGGAGNIVYRDGNSRWGRVPWKGGTSVRGITFGGENQADIAVCKNGDIVEGYREDDTRGEEITYKDGSENDR